MSSIVLNSKRKGKVYGGIKVGTTFYTERKDRLVLTVKVRPGAGTNAVVGSQKDELVVKIKAHAQKGKANGELVSFLAKTLGTSKSDILIVTGAKSRHKVLSLHKSCRQALERLSRALTQS